MKLIKDNFFTHFIFTETISIIIICILKANPPQLERCEDIASLRCLNECGALHVLRSRHAAALPHARAGHALLVMGPPKRTTPVYTEKVCIYLLFLFRVPYIKMKKRTAYRITLLSVCQEHLFGDRVDVSI